jgi:WD40 repeat protein
MPLILLTIKIWDTNLGVLKKTLNGHTDTIRDFVLLDKNILASAAEDYTIKIWNISEGRVKQNLTGPSNKTGI